MVAGFSSVSRFMRLRDSTKNAFDQTETLRSFVPDQKQFRAEFHEDWLERKPPTWANITNGTRTGTRVKKTKPHRYDPSMMSAFL